MRRSTRNVLGYAVPQVFWGFAWAISLDAPMIAAFGEHFGAADDFVGTIWLLIGIGLSIPMVIAAWVTQPFRRKLSVVFWGHIAGGLVLLALTGALHWSEGAEATRRVYAIGVMAFFLCIGFLVPPWLSLIGDLFREGQRTRVLGITFVFNRLGGFAGGAFARSALEAHAEPWVGLFAIASVLMLVGSLAFLCVDETHREPQPRAPLRTYLAGLLHTLRANRALRWFIAADLIGVSFFVLLAHFSKAGFQAGLPESVAGTWTQFGALGILIAALATAWQGHRLLPRTWIAMSLLLCSVGALLVAWDGAAWVYSAASMTCGICIGARMTCHSPEVMRLCQGDATAAVGVAGALATTMQGLLPFVAGLVLLETSYAPVFVAVAILTTLAGLLMMGLGARLGPSPRETTAPTLALRERDT